MNVIMDEETGFPIQIDAKTGEPLKYSEERPYTATELVHMACK